MKGREDQNENQVTVLEIISELPQWLEGTPISSGQEQSITHKSSAKSLVQAEDLADFFMYVTFLLDNFAL